MAHKIPCEKCYGLGGTARLEGQYPNAKARNEKCNRCNGTGLMTDPDGR
jgi:DnaJ-class molecular chaperone